MLMLFYNLQTGRLEIVRPVDKCQYHGATQSDYYLAHHLRGYAYVDSFIIETEVSSKEYLKSCESPDEHTYEIYDTESTEGRGILLPKYMNSCVEGKR